MINVIEVQTEFINRYESVFSTLLFKQYNNAINYINNEITQYKNEEFYLDTILPFTDVWKVKFEDYIIVFRVNHKTFVDND